MPSLLQLDQPPDLTPARIVAPLTCTVARTLADVEALRGDWQDLLEASARPEPMLTPEWLLTWWRVYGSERELAVGVFRQAGRLVGLAPMCRRTFRYRPGLPFRRIEWLGADVDEQDGVCSDYLHVIARQGSEGPVCERLVQELVAGRFGAWDEWILPAVDGTHPLNPVLTGAWARAGFTVDAFTKEVAPYLTLPASWDDYLGSVNKKRRQSIRYTLRDFDAWADGAAEFHRAVDPESLARGMEILRLLHGERWQGAEGGDAFGSPRFTTFHEAWSRHLLQTGRLHLHWLTVRGTPVAAHYSFAHRNKLYYYQTGRRLDVPDKVRLGIVLLIHVIRAAIAEGRSEFDFLAGEATYKRLFTHTERPLLRLRVARGGAREIVRQTLAWGARHWRAWRSRRIQPSPDVNEG